MELGHRAIGSIELERLARFLGRDLGEFFAADFEGDDALAILFRAEPEIGSVPGLAERLEECLALGREITHLELLLGVERTSGGAVSYEAAGPQSRWEAIRQGERAAEEERRRMGLGWSPVPPLAEVLEGQGVRTGMVDLPEEISGLTIGSGRPGMFLVVNRRHVPARRRFSLAHEYAHALFDRRRAGVVSRVKDRGELMEVRANAFAAAYLAPREGIRSFLTGQGKGKPSRASARVYDEAGSVEAEGRAEPGSQDVQMLDVVRLAAHFGVSRMAALYRLRNLRLVSEGEFAELAREEGEGRGRALAGALGLEGSDDGPERDGFRQRAAALAVEAYRRELISRAKVAELAALVSMDSRAVDVLLERAGLAGGDAADVLIPGE
jgi:hypothetical protein